MGPGAGRWRRLPDPWGRPPGVGSGGGRRVVKSRRAVSGRGAAVAGLLGGLGGRSGGLPWSSAVYAPYSGRRGYRVGGLPWSSQGRWPLAVEGSPLTLECL